VSTLRIQLPNNNAFAKFVAAHGSVILALDKIAEAHGNILKTLAETSIPNKPRRDRVTTLLTMMNECYTEFGELTALATFGFGSGSTKLLRGLTERVTTTLYLMKHPRQIKRFTEYTAVHEFKLLQEYDRVLRTKRKDAYKKKREDIVKAYEAVRSNYERKPCGKCKDKVLTLCRECRSTLKKSLSWTPKSVPDLAKDVSKKLRKLFLNIYSVPTFHLHTSDYSVRALRTQRPDGVWILQDEHKEWDAAHTAIIMACGLMLFLADGCRKYLKLDLQKECLQIDEASQAIIIELRPYLKAKASKA